MNFSGTLQHLRKQMGISQEELADRMGVSRQAVSKWESGAAFPELEKLVALSRLFHVSVDFLVKDEVSDNAPEGLKNEKVPESESVPSPKNKRNRLAVYTALAVVLYGISPFWFPLLGKTPGGGGKGVFFMFACIAAATGLLIYRRYSGYTAAAATLFIICPFWFPLLGEIPGGGGKGVFLMFACIAIAAGLLIYHSGTGKKSEDK